MTSPPAAGAEQGVSEVTLRTEVGVYIPLERFNAMKDEAARHQFLKIRAYQALRGLCGGEARDFNRLEQLLETEGGIERLTPGIAIRISEADKDWAVPHAHAQGLTLGAWLQKIVDDQLAIGRRAT